MTHIALTIAGSDSGGGAGIQADLKTFSALGVYGASVLTAVTAQNTRAVTAITALSPTIIRAQIEAVFDDLAISAIKIGMLGRADIIRTVAEAIAPYQIPLVLDPVMIAKSGDRLLDAEAVRALRDHLLPLATILTPNLPEAAELLERPCADDLAVRLEQGKDLQAIGPRWVLMKGGHAEGATCTDLLIGRDVQAFSAPRIATRNTHGTGCTLSAAIAAGLAQGLEVGAAVAQAHHYLQGAIAAADRLTIGSGHGPVHHFHQWWQA